jgi:serine/threonine protein kinase
MPQSLVPGACVGEARIVRVLGAGSVATVYEVAWRGRRCALKIVDGVAGSPALAARLAQEAEALSMIDHLNVVRWLGAGIHEGRVWILLELVEGRDLRREIHAAGGRLPQERAVAIARHACDGLVAVHRRGIVHRDVSPENILVTLDDVAKIADFSSAKLPGWGVKTTHTRRLTALRYAPPEHWRGGGTPSPMFDVYAMGLVVHELLTGAHPLAAENADPLTLCDRHLHAAAPPLRALVPEVGGELSDLVARALEKDPARRCAMSDLAAGLEQELDRSQAPRRRAARNAVARDEDPSMSATIPMSAYPGPDEGEGREAALPSAPSAEVPVPATLRVLSRPGAVIQAEAAAIEAEAGRRSTSAPVESSARRSLPARRGRAAVVGVVGVVVLAAGAAVTWWTMGLSGGGGGEAPRVAGPGPAGSGSAAGSGSGSASASAKVAPPRPSGSASGGRPAGKGAKGPRR